MRFGLVTRSQFSSRICTQITLVAFAHLHPPVCPFSKNAQDDTVVEILKLMGVPADMYDFTTDYTRIFEDGLHVEAVPVKHASDMKCCGLLICDEEETTYFSADASELSDDILQQFKQGKIQVIYHDCTFLTKESPSHCSLKRLCEYIPPEMRNRVYCMHFGGDFMSQIKEAGFQVVTSV